MVVRGGIEPQRLRHCLGLSQHRREIAYGYICTAGRRCRTANGTEGMPSQRRCYRVGPRRKAREAKLPIHIRQRRSGVGSAQIDDHVLDHDATYRTRKTRASRRVGCRRKIECGSIYAACRRYDTANGTENEPRKGGDHRIAPGRKAGKARHYFAP